MAALEKMHQKVDITTICESKPNTSLKNVPNRADGEKKYVLHCCVSNSFRRQCRKLMKSKLTYFLCIIIYIFICMLGNIIAATTWIKHHFSANYTSYVPLPSEKNGFHLFHNELQSNGNESEDTLTSIFELMYNKSEPKDHKHDTSCYEPLGDKRREYAKYWTEGVAIVIVGALGMVGNTFSIFVFRRSRGNKGFHTLLIILAFSDNLLIIDSFIQKSLIPYFTTNAPFEPNWFKISNPYFWHPFKGIIVTVTIYLMVAISAERFRAVCYPMSKRQVRKFLKENNSPYKYVTVVIVMSVILKLPRFFHFKLIYMNDVPQYWTTPIIEDPDYIRFSSYWDDLFTTGFLPLAISMFFNLKIYLKIKRSAKMNCDRYVGTGLAERVIPISRRRQSSPAISRNRKTTRHVKINTLNLQRKQNQAFLSVLKNNQISVSTEHLGSIHLPVTKTLSMPTLKVNTDDENENSNSVKDGAELIELMTTEDYQQPVEKIKSKPINCKIMVSKRRTRIGTLDYSAQYLMNHKDNVQQNNMIQEVESYPLAKRLLIGTRNKKLSTKLKVRTEKSAIVFALMVILFLLTHSYRMALKVYEVLMPNSFSVENVEMCFSLKRNHVPVTFYILFHLNNLFIVVNSSITFLVWYSVDKEFRKTTIAILKEMSEIICSPFVKLWKSLLFCISNFN